MSTTARAPEPIVSTQLRSRAVFDVSQLWGLLAVEPFGYPYTHFRTSYSRHPNMILAPSGEKRVLGADPVLRLQKFATARHEITIFGKDEDLCVRWSQERYLEIVTSGFTDRSFCAAYVRWLMRLLDDFDVVCGDCSFGTPPMEMGWPLCLDATPSMSAWLNIFGTDPETLFLEEDLSRLAEQFKELRLLRTARNLIVVIGDSPLESPPPATMRKIGHSVRESFRRRFDERWPLQFRGEVDKRIGPVAREAGLEPSPAIDAILPIVAFANRQDAIELHLRLVDHRPTVVVEGYRVRDRVTTVESRAELIELLDRIAVDIQS